jgi:hypothetical protein
MTHHRPTTMSGSVALMLALALGLNGLATAQAPSRPAESSERQTSNRIVKLKAWPMAGAKDAKRVLALLAQYRKDDDELAQQATAELVGMGDLAVEMLFKQVADREKNESQNERIFALLDQLLGPRHADLMAKAAGNEKKTALRRYLTRRIAGFRDPDLAAFLAAAAADDEADTSFYGSLGLLALGDKTGIAPVIVRCRQDWDEIRDLIAETLAPARDATIARAISEEVAKARPLDQANGLRLMRYLAPKEQMVVIQHYLDSEDFTVKKAAINALRVMHGMEPLEKLSAFSAVEMAKEWKSR